MRRPENMFKYNGKELQYKEFSDGTGLEEYNYNKHFYDPQIGKFIEIDSHATNFPWWTSYQFTGNEPIKYVDLDSMMPAYYNPRPMNGRRLVTNCSMKYRLRISNILLKLNI